MIIFKNKIIKKFNKKIYINIILILIIMKTFSSIVYNTKNPTKYKKEKTYQKIKDYFLKIALTGDSKILFRCYDINNLDCTCYQTIKSPEEIFELYEEMNIYETGSVLFNVITKNLIMIIQLIIIKNQIQ